MGLAVVLRVVLVLFGGGEVDGSSTGVQEKEARLNFDQGTKEEKESRDKIGLDTSGSTELEEENAESEDSFHSGVVYGRRQLVWRAPVEIFA